MTIIIEEKGDADERQTKLIRKKEFN